MNDTNILQVTVATQAGNILFTQQVEGTQLLSKVMSEVMTSPPGDALKITIVVNGEPMTLTKGSVDVRKLVMILNDLRLPISRAKKATMNV